MEVRSKTVPGHTGDLEVLYSLPSDPQPAPDATPLKPAIVLIHGSFCSAHCYVNFLPYLAQHGHPAYALSVRGHGASHTQTWTQRMLFTSLASWAEDTKAVIAHVVESHPDAPPPVLAGHSLGGGAVQHMLAAGLLQPYDISAVVLLAASPLSGGGAGIGKNWERVEAPEGYPYPWSPRCVLETTDQVRAAFFTEETKAESVQDWLDNSKTVEESARAGLRILWGLGAAKDVLQRLVGVELAGGKRKMLFVAAGSDRLIPAEMVWENAKVYEDVARCDDEGETACGRLLVEKSGHHLMLDDQWEFVLGALWHGFRERRSRRCTGQHFDCRVDGGTSGESDLDYSATYISD